MLLLRLLLPQLLLRLLRLKSYHRHTPFCHCLHLMRLLLRCLCRHQMLLLRLLRLIHILKLRLRLLRLHHQLRLLRLLNLQLRLLLLQLLYLRLLLLRLPNQKRLRILEFLALYGALLPQVL
jgi:hypothetical protein